jgi:hypothetical protein
MEVWAAAHARDICVVTRANGRGILMDLSDYNWAMQEGFTLVPISYCNPAE